MKHLCSRIKIGSIYFNIVAEIEVVSSWDSLTDTAKITIPKKLLVDGKPLVEGVNSVFKIGDPVQIECGYDLQYDTIFQGYVSFIKPGVPVVIECEDAMWLFKRQTFQKAFASVTVKQLIDFMLPLIPAKFNVKYSFPNMQLGKFRIQRGATGADVFEELRKTYKIYSFFREGTLFVGFANTHPEGGSDYRRNVDFYFNDTIISDDLTYRTKDNFFLKVLGTSIIPGKKGKEGRLKSAFGATGGQEIKLQFYGLSQSALDKVVENEYKTFHVSGFKGDFETFGKPYVRQGDAAVLNDHLIPERSGTYEVKKVTRRYGQQGYRQRVELGLRLA